MILIITNKLDPHVDAVIWHLKNGGVDFVRFNTEDFPQKIVFTWQSGGSPADRKIQFPTGREVSLSQISSCWYRRPNPPVVSSDLTTKQAVEFARDETNTLLNCFLIYFF